MNETRPVRVTGHFLIYQRSPSAMLYLKYSYFTSCISLMTLDDKASSAHPRCHINPNIYDMYLISFMKILLYTWYGWKMRVCSELDIMCLLKSCNLLNIIFQLTLSLLWLELLNMPDNLCFCCPVIDSPG